MPPMLAATVTMVSVVTAPMADMAATVTSVDMVIMEQHQISTEIQIDHHLQNYKKWKHSKTEDKR